MTAGNTGGLAWGTPNQLVSNNRTKHKPILNTKSFESFETSTSHVNDGVFSKITFFHYKVWSSLSNKQNLFFMLVGPFVVPTHIRVNSLKSFI